MLLLACQNLTKSFGSRILFNGLSFSILSEDRIGMVGPNGAGKSTLLKMIADIEPLTDGLITKKKGIKIGYIPQEELFPDASIIQILSGIRPFSISIPDWERHLSIYLEKAGFLDPHQNAKLLSGGFQKRLSFLKAWVLEPDLLLFDEPTNHLDLETLFWLENILSDLPCALVIISHDRVFLNQICNKVIEINHQYPKGCLIVEGSYQTYLERKESFLESNLQLEHHLKSKLKKELAWLKTSPKARTTKAESRIQDTQALQDQFQMIRAQNKKRNIQLDLDSSQRNTQKLISIHNLTKSLGGKPLFQGLDLTISPKTRLGLLGFNGSGKTTLFKILNRELKPDLGTIKYADDLKIVYFRQNREIFEKKETLRAILSPNSDYVTFMGVSTHINGFCKTLGFSPSDLDMPCFKLSGGEKARALIGRLMLEKADVLLLDEPTNDLDVETLDLFLDVLRKHEGAILLISHDRYFLNAVCDEMIALGIDETPQFYQDFEQFEEALKAKKEKPKILISDYLPPQIEKPKNEKKIASILKKIEHLEKEITLLNEELDLIDHSEKLTKHCELIAQKTKTLETFFEEWEKLES